MFNTCNMSPADYAAVSNNNGGLFGGENGWSFIIILALLLGWGNGGWGGNGGSIMQNYTLNSDFATIQRQLSDGFNSIDNALDRQNSGICDLGYTNLSLNNQTNMNMMQGFNAIQSQLADCCCKTQQNIKDVNYNVATTGAGITSAIKDCCCDTEKQFMQSRFDMAQYNCQTQTAIDKLGDRILGFMVDRDAQALRDENQALRQYVNNDALVRRLQPTPVPSFPAQNLYPFYGYGYGTTIA